MSSLSKTLLKNDRHAFDCLAIKGASLFVVSSNSRFEVMDSASLNNGGPSVLGRINSQPAYRVREFEATTRIITHGLERILKVYDRTVASGAVLSSKLTSDDGNALDTIPGGTSFLADDGS